MPYFQLINFLFCPPLLNLFCARFKCLSGNVQNHRKLAADSASFQLSPIVCGIVLTLFILATYCFVRVFMRREQHKNDTTIDSSKQSSSLLCNGTAAGGGAGGGGCGTGSGGSTGAGNAVTADTAQKVGI